MKKIVLSLIATVLFSVGHAQHVPQKGYVSWIPAQKWEDALRSGNGTMGALVMGDPFAETIILNHALLYIPNEAPVTPPNMAPYRDEITMLSLDGKYEEVAKLGYGLWQEKYGKKKWTDPYVPAADVNIDMEASNVKEYYRMVNYETAEAIVHWVDEKGSFTRKAFVSRADSVVVIQITSDTKFSLSLNMGKHPHSWEENSTVEPLIKTYDTSVTDDFMHFHFEYAKAHSHSADGYDGILAIKANGARISTEDGKYIVKDANEVLITCAIEPYKGINDDVVAELKQRVNRYVNEDYESLLQAQVETHGSIYNRVSLNLNPTDEERAMTSETLVSRAWNQGETAGIIQREFEACRYNILCSSGINPPNLQGIWSGTWTPPWCSDFTHDGNIEVAISNNLIGNMPELMKGYFDYHERNMEDYRVNAKQFYGIDGIHIPSHTSSHGLNNHYDETWCMEYWNGGASWTAFYYYDYYLYTHDKDFLKNEAFPFMSEALAFWKNFLIEGHDGIYMSVPSYSPENNPQEHQWQNCINSTMDIAMIKELTRNWIAAAELLGVNKKEIKENQEFLTKLPEYQVADDGVFREWLWEGLSDNQAHRHASHLYGVYEIPDPDILMSDELQSAVKKTIKARMKIREEQGGGEMAFGMCHLAFAAVNMGDRETVEDILEYLSRFYWTNGMATTHNPGELFNMDISGGFPSLISRMIMNSRPGYVTLFPTLPEEWKKRGGEINGLLARGNIKFNTVKWGVDGVLVNLVSPENQRVKIDLSTCSTLSKLKVKGAKYKLEENVLILDMEQDQQIEITL